MNPHAIWARWRGRLSPAQDRPVGTPRTRDPERLVAVTRILDEADIVEAFVRHTAAYASHHVFLDNGSTDGTVEILRSLAAEGVKLTVLQAASPAFRELETNTMLFQEAAGCLEAGWAVHLDADEFIDDRAVPGGLVRGLAGLARDDPDVRAVDVPMRTYVRQSSDDPTERVVPIRMRGRVDSGPVTKVVLRGDLLDQAVRVGPGNHVGVFSDGRPVPAVALPGLVYGHYYERSPAQLLAKSVKGWSKILAAGPIVAASGTNFHYRPLFEALRDAPESYLRNSVFLHDRLDPGAVTDDPIDYKGGPLLYTNTIDHEMRAVRALIGHLEMVSVRYGRLVSESPDAQRLADRLDRAIERLI